MWNDHKLLAKAARSAMKALGLELFGEVPCEIVTSALVPVEIGSKIVKILRESYWSLYR